MKQIFIVIVLALSLSSLSQEELMRDPITGPVLSLRCKELFKERAREVKLQQRLNALLERSDDLLKKTPKNKETLVAKITSSRIKVKNKLYLANLQIESMEENIVRAGCPGLLLE